MAADRSTAKRAGDQPIRDRAGPNATVRRTASGREMSPLQLYDARTRAKQTFVPADRSGRVGLFVCGPTVYDLPHQVHAKTYTQFDFLVRLPRARGFAVTYVQKSATWRQDH